jgi:hypothetical protein
MGLVAQRKLSAASLALLGRTLLASPCKVSAGRGKHLAARGVSQPMRWHARMLAVVEFHLDHGAARCDYSPPASAIIVPEVVL